MDGVQGITSLAAGDGRHHLFRTLGPTLLISMAYIDLGKWVATIDAGARFGYDHVLVVLLFNCSAILCQYLSAYIGMVTGKNLAEICHQEYSQAIRGVLGLQAALSLLVSEVTMVAGIAVGFSIVFEYDDVAAGIYFASVAVILLPYIISHLDKRMAGTLHACIAGFTLLCFVLGVLVSQPKIPMRMNVNVMFPKLSGESAYSLMSLLGSNVIAHNFYVHSSVVQVQRRQPVRTLGSLFHDHLFSVVFIFSGVFLVNYILVSSAADEVSNPMLMNSQDAVELMHQIFNNPLAPVLLLVILIFSSLIISLTSIISSDVVSDNFFSVKLPYSVHHLLLKGFAMIPTIYCAKVGGSEGMYQLIIICPIIQAMVLPSSVIPVFRISSSRVLMGRCRISLYIEILAVLAFLLMLFTNIIFLAEILFGDSSWTNNMRRNTDSPVVLPYMAVLLISCASIAFTLFLAATPLKSASIEADSQELSMHPQMEILGTPHHREETCQQNATEKEVEKFSVDAVVRDSLEGQQRQAFGPTEYSGSTTQSDQDSHYPTAQAITNSEGHLSAYNEELKSAVVDWTETMPNVHTATKVEGGTAENIKVKSTTGNIVEVESDFHTEKDKEVSCNLKFEQSGGDRTPITSDGSNLTCRLSRPSGFGRAARRQLTALLDEFWGYLFDYHGQLTPEANVKCFNSLVGMDLRKTSSVVRTDNLSEASWSPLMTDVIRRSATTLNPSDPLSCGKGASHPHLDLGLHTDAMESSNWSPSIHKDIRCFGGNAESLSNLNVSSYSDNQFYQPATIHGYRLATYLKEINASRRLLPHIPLDPRRFTRSSESSFPNYTDSFMHGHNQNVLGSPGGSSLQSPTVNHLNTMMFKRSYYDPTSIGGNESACSSSYTKKYHSSPDISAVIAAGKNNTLSEANLNSGAVGNQPYLSRLAYGKSHYLDATTTPSQHVFNKLSHHSLQRDVLPTQSSVNTDTKSLWTQQPFDQLFGVSSTECSKSEPNPDWRSSVTSDVTYIKPEAELVNSVRLCIRKLMQLEGSQWLFRQNGGCDENLISHIAEAEIVSREETTDIGDANCMHRPLGCGDDCIWQASLVTSFGVWCVHRVLDLSLVESRPELWGKYTYVLNRLQGILDPAFSKPRKPLRGCACLAKTGSAGKLIPGTFTTAAAILELIKGVEQAVSSRRGRSGTAAGNIAFPKGKENLASVLKRYKRRLAGKTSAGAQQ
ncbi:hypothetical protein QOZ80_3BG0265310 [Eleusine coracana subsp. coracana]|nr:hypothetical protein QOZ80_3BG0265310 [Eleusine coracana subsp. coracana]